MWRQCLHLRLHRFRIELVHAKRSIRMDETKPLLSLSSAQE